MKKSLVLGAAVLVLALAGGATVYAVGLRSRPADGGVSQLLGNDYGKLRLDALAMFPRGSPVGEVAEKLKALGFQCTPARHLMPNINAPSVQCDSAGRGFPRWSRLQVTVLARNDMVSDIAIGNGFDPLVADARTPSPAPFGGEPKAGKGDGAAEGGAKAAKKGDAPSEAGGTKKTPKQEH